MDQQKQIAINELLLKRDEEFQRIAEIERRINGELDAQGYPFELPFPMLSLERRKRPAKKKKPTKKSVSLKALPFDDACYKVCGTLNEEPYEEIHQSKKLVELMLVSFSENKWIEEVYVQDKANGSEDLIWSLELSHS